MKKVLFVLAIMFCQNISFSQISRQLQDAINSTTIRQTRYSANRNRNARCQVYNKAYQYAYYKLPYAIDLNQYQNYAGTISEEVIIKFSSVDLSGYSEQRILSKAINELSDLLARQQKIARIAEQRAQQAKYSRSSSVAIAAQGEVIVAYREIESIQGLIGKLRNRYTYLE